MNEPQPVPLIPLRRFQVVSPSLAETLRVCPLRGLLSQSAGVNDYVLGSPKAWLGTAYHSVLDQAARGSFDLDGDDPVGRLWADAIDRLYRDVKAHPLNKRFGSPGQWPGYHVTLAGVRLRVAEAHHGRHVHMTSLAPVASPVSPVHEQRFTACGT